MTLLAEGFNYMKKLGLLVHGESKPAVGQASPQTPPV
jgi:hypothetical protein